jgi:hypothetical protein
MILGDDILGEGLFADPIEQEIVFLWNEVCESKDSYTAIRNQNTNIKRCDDAS